MNLALQIMDSLSVSSPDPMARGLRFEEQVLLAWGGQDHFLIFIGVEDVEAWLQDYGLFLLEMALSNDEADEQPNKVKQRLDRLKQSLEGDFQECLGDFEAPWEKLIKVTATENVGFLKLSKFMDSLHEEVQDKGEIDGLTSYKEAMALANGQTKKILKRREAKQGLLGVVMPKQVKAVKLEELPKLKTKEEIEPSDSSSMDADTNWETESSQSRYDEFNLLHVIRDTMDMYEEQGEMKNVTFHEDLVEQCRLAGDADSQVVSKLSKKAFLWWLKVHENATYSLSKLDETKIKIPIAGKRIKVFKSRHGNGSLDVEKDEDEISKFLNEDDSEMELHVDETYKHQRWHISEDVQIYAFKQKENEKVKEASLRFKQYIKRCPRKELPQNERLSVLFIEGLRNETLKKDLHLKACSTFEQVTREALYLVDNCKVYGEVNKDTGSIISGASSVKTETSTRKDALAMPTIEQMIEEVT
ncbi:hypothetical protein L7F22_029023 [Adiantum nelumboides]|nr:hypothetical protein [Adiantum nelumboides]